MTSPLRPPHRRLLALDPGERRVGVAVSDELGMFAHPRTAIRVRSERQVLSEVAELVADEAISEVIVGLPLTMAGHRGHQADAARALVEALRRTLQVTVREWDERLSSAEAARHLGRPHDRKSGTLDSAAAAVVLQAVLDSRRPGSEL